MKATHRDTECYVVIYSGQDTSLSKDPMHTLIHPYGLFLFYQSTKELKENPHGYRAAITHHTLLSILSARLRNVAERIFLFTSENIR